MTVTAADHANAASIATKAGELLLEVRSALEDANTHPQQVKDAGDRAAHDFIVAALAEQYPDDAVLSEEGVDDPKRLTAERVWIVDPLDGTREFSEPGRRDWAVHVALGDGRRGRCGRGRAARARASRSPTFLRHRRRRRSATVAREWW